LEVENKVREVAGLPIPGAAPVEARPAPDEKKVAPSAKSRYAEDKPVTASPAPVPPPRSTPMFKEEDLELDTDVELDAVEDDTAEADT
jgi:hypothetical protein